MISAIAQLNSSDRVISQLQQNIIQPVNQLLKNPIVQGNFLFGVSLSEGENVISHGLGRKLQGWSIVDIDSEATIYRSAELNSQTLTLTSSANATVSIYVF